MASELVESTMGAVLHKPLKAEMLRVVGLNSWDGPTVGVLRCEECGAEFFFDLIDWLERDEADVRVFALAPLPAGSFERIVEVCRLPTSTPRWPVWLPVWRFSTPEALAAAGKRIEQVLAGKGEYKIIAAWRGNWFESFITAKDVLPADAQEVTDSLKVPRRAKKVRDWLSYLSIDVGLL